ncbi:hypothetical protein ES706_01848 [subsurface metagenome]
MAENVDLKALDKKIFKTTNEDGLMDIYLGILFMSMGIQALFRDIVPGVMGYLGIYLIIIGFAFTFFIIGKKKITAPRMGIVKISVKTSPIKKKLVLFLGINVAVSFIIFILTFLGLFQFVQIDPIIFTLSIGLGIITLPISLLAYFSKTPRWYIIAIVLGLGFFLSEIFYPVVGSPLDSFIAFSITGGSIIVMGLVVLSRFIKKYPLKNYEPITE